MSKATMQRLSHVELFEGCRRSLLAKIDELGESLVVPSEQTLCVEGTPGEEFFVLIEGLVEIAPGVRARLQLSASLVLHSAIPTRRQCYEQIPSGIPPGVACVSK